jgi:hypothetical protein
MGEMRMGFAPEFVELCIGNGVDSAERDAQANAWHQRVTAFRTNVLHVNAWNPL